MVQSNSQKTFLGTAMKQYQNDLHQNPELLDYLTVSRGLSEDSLAEYGLGVVANPLEGHERLAGRISIPYITPSGVVDIRFRKAPGAGDNVPKYYTLPGSESRIYATTNLLKTENRICIAEGEFEAIMCSQAGFPCVGLPGAQSWKDYYKRIFAGYEEAVVFADGDRPDDSGRGTGEKFAEKVIGELAKVSVRGRMVLMEDEGDVNSFIKEHGENVFAEYAKLN